VGEIEDAQHAEYGGQTEGDQKKEHPPAEPVQQVDDKAFQGDLMWCGVNAARNDAGPLSIDGGVFERLWMRFISCIRCQ
jgi:hypothetical protein